MTSHSDVWLSSDGVRLHSTSWIPDTQARGAIGLVHGIGEHLGRYEHVGTRLNQAGYAVIGCDLRGHGHSGGQRGDAPSYEALMNDVDLLVRKTATVFPGVPHFLYGHSMGGNLVLNYMLRRKPDVVGAIVTCPGLKPVSGWSPLRLLLGRILRYIAPMLLVSNEIDTQFLSRDRKVVFEYLSDPLVHDRVSVRLGLDLIAAGAWALRHARTFCYPLLLLQGGADRIVDPQTNVAFGKSIGQRCQRRIWPDLYHEIHNEPEQEEVFLEIISWLNRHVP